MDTFVSTDRRYACKQMFKTSVVKMVIKYNANSDTFKFGVNMLILFEETYSLIFTN